MNVPSRIEQVTVYSSGAVVRRLATAVAPPDGMPRVIEIPGLPLTLQATSLRASVVKGPQELRIVDVRSRIISRPTAVVDVPAEQEALEAVEERLSRLKVDLGAVDRDIVDLRGLRASWPTTRKGDPPRPSRPESTLVLMEFVGAELKKRLARRAELARQIEDAGHEVELHRHRLSEASRKQKGELELSRTAAVTLSAAGAPGELTLGLEYLVPGARWSPSYELRLDKDLVRATLVLRAAVAQATGEDWAGVKLSLSTADLDRRTDLPELKSLRVGRIQPAPPRPGWREPAPGLDEMFEEYAALQMQKPRTKTPPVQAPTASPTPARTRRPRAGIPGEVGQFAPGIPGEPALETLEEAGELSFGSRLDFEEGGGPPAAMRAAAATAGPIVAMAGASAPTGGTRAPRRARAAAAPPPAASAEGDEEEAPPHSAPALEVDPSLLDYEMLVMGRPEDTSRGRLRRASETEWLMSTEVHLQVDVKTVLKHIQVCDRTAKRISTLAPPQGAVPLRQSAGSFDHRYDCVDRVGVAANGAWQVVPVLSADAGVAVEYTSTPSVEPNVYRILRLENLSAHALLSGPVSVLVDDDYVLTSSLPPLMAGHKAVLGLGVTEAIQIARNTIYKETTVGLMGGQSLLQHEIEIELRNGLTVPASVKVRERVPVAQLETIKVEETLVRPEWQKDEGPEESPAIQGGRAWTFTVPSGEKVKLVAHYTIRIPADKALVGGNRRVH